MIRTLQRRFLWISMLAVSVLILLLLGAINAANIALVGGQIERTLEILTRSEGDAGKLTGAPAFLPPHEPAWSAPPNAYDTFMASNFFVVRFDGEGAAVRADVRRTSQVSQEQALQWAQEAYDQGLSSGRRGDFRFRLAPSAQGEGSFAVFLDTSWERRSFVRVLLLSCGVGLACWGLMLLLVSLMSKRAIRPIAQNMERQRRFVTNAGHEIKTPLAIIQANVEAMELYNGENKWSHNIREQTVRLAGLMQNLLALARMDEGAAQPHPTELRLDELVERALEGYAEAMEQRGLRLQAQLEPGLRVRADRAQLEQLLALLLDNAVKHADQGGQILVELSKGEGGALLRLENSCAKLPDAEPEKLFERFYRGDDARNQKDGGYGIGLSIARALAQANGGRLDAEYGQNSRIIFKLRL